MSVVKNFHQRLEKLPKILFNPYRLMIMCEIAQSTIEEETNSFTRLKDFLGLSDGNLASHLRSLRKAQFITMHKQFVENKPKTTYTMTNRGADALQEVTTFLRELL